MSQEEASREEGPRKNVLLVLFDDLNDWVMPSAGYPGLETPEFERLAEEGLVFENAYSDAPACNPSRTALLSGLRPTTNGVYFNGQPYLAALPESYTLVEYFAAHGYRTLGSGKIFHTYNQGKQVWDEFYRRGPNPTLDAREEEPLFSQEHFAWGPLDVGLEAMADARVARQAARWLERPDLGPFFMVIGFTKPHLPWFVPREFFDEVPLSAVPLPPHREDDLDDVPPMGRRLARQDKHREVMEAGAWGEAVQGYLANLRFADRILGIVLEGLRESPHRDDTVVVVASDHGYHLGEKEHWGKYTLWQRANRIPLIVIAPGSGGAGRTTAAPVTLVDLYPTLAQLCGLPAPENLDGTSFAPLFEDPSKSWPQAAVSVHRRGNYAVRDGRWSYLRYADGTEELYDRERDPHEWENLAGSPEAPAVKERLGAAIPEIEAPYAPIAFSSTDTEKAAEKLLRFHDAEELIRQIEKVQEERARRRAREPQPKSSPRSGTSR